MESKNFLITGGAGFIGSYLAERLIELKNNVTIIDNLSSGKNENISKIINDIDFINVDLTKYIPEIHNIDVVFHLAADPIVKMDINNMNSQFDKNVLVTHRLLEAMRKNNIKTIIFSSTSAVYGDAKKIPTREDYGPLEPLSLYGATKLACENLMCAYSHLFDLSCISLRFANIIGPRNEKGVIYDLIRKLKINPNELEIFGDGNQNKSYVFIDDCINAMTKLTEDFNGFNIFNVGNVDQIKVKDIAKIICDNMGIDPKINFENKKRGWVGDVPEMLLDINKIKTEIGWYPKINSKDAVIKTILQGIKI